MNKAELNMKSTEKIHYRIRTFLLLLLLALAEFHFFCCTFRETLKDYGKVPKIWEQWGFLVLLTIVLLYLLLTLFFFPKERPHLKNFIRSFRSFEQLYLLALFIWAIFSCFFIGRALGKNLFEINDNYLYEYAFIALVFFPMARYVGHDHIYIVKLLIKLVYWPCLILCACMLWKYIHFESFVFPSGWSLSEGEPYAFTYGVNPNLTGSLTLTMFLLSLMFTVSEKSFIRWLYCFGAVVFAVALVLSNCRTAWYASLITLPIFIFFLIQNTCFPQNKTIRILVGLISAFAAVILFQQFRIRVFDHIMQARDTAMVNAALQQTRYRIQDGTSPVHLMSHLSSSVLSQTFPQIKELASDHLRTFESGLTGRVQIYKASFVVMFSRKLIFLFGTTPADIGKHLYGLCGVNKVYVHAHNLFLQTGVGLGVPAMLGMIVFILLLFLKGLRLITYRNVQSSPGVWCIPVVMFGLLIADMMESFLAASIWGPAGTVFFLLAGWLAVEVRNS